MADDVPEYDSKWRCIAITNRGRRCSKPAEDGEHFCVVEEHNRENKTIFDTDAYPDTNVRVPPSTDVPEAKDIHDRTH